MPYKDPETRRAYKRAYYARKRAQQRAHRRQRYHDSPAIRRRAQAYYRDHRERLKEQARQYYVTNKAKRVERLAAHPEIGRVTAARRRTRQAEAARNDLSPAQWREIQAAYGHRCVYCGKKPKLLTMDHVIPFAKGGTHSVPNVVPACLRCNKEKFTSAPKVPIQPLLLTVAAPSKRRTA